MKERHLRLILNGKGAGREDVRDAIKALRSTGHEISIRVTYEAGDVGRLTREAMREAGEMEIDVLIFGGGDGTLHEGIDTIVSETPRDADLPFVLAVLPLGTANDFARQIHLKSIEPLSCLRHAARAPAKATDVGLVNDRAFINMATGGFGTKITAEADPNLKRMLGGAAYLFTGLQRFSELAPCEGRIEADDFTWEGRFLALAVGNGRSAGGGVNLCPTASLDDGYLDLTIVSVPKNGRIVELLEPLLERGVEGLRERVIMQKVKSLRIETSDTLQMNLDGEPIHDKRFEIEVLPARLQMLR